MSIPCIFVYSFYCVYLWGLKVSIVSLLSIISMPVASMKAIVKEKVQFNALLDYKTNPRLPHCDWDIRFILTRLISQEFVLVLMASTDSMHLFVFRLVQSIQVDINRYPTHDSNSTWSGGLFTGTVSADVV